MNRRSATWVLRILLLAAATTLPLVVAAPGGAGADDARVGGRTPGAPVTSPDDIAPGGAGSGDTVPTDTANPFLPEERDLTDCLGLLQRPGCGSEARGGLGQALVAILMIGGLVLIFGRVAWGVRRNRNRQAPPSDAGASSDEPTGGLPDAPADGGTVDSTRRDDPA